MSYKQNRVEVDPTGHLRSKSTIANEQSFAESHLPLNLMPSTDCLPYANKNIIIPTQTGQSFSRSTSKERVGMIPLVGH